MGVLSQANWNLNPYSLWRAYCSEEVHVLRVPAMFQWLMGCEDYIRYGMCGKYIERVGTHKGWLPSLWLDRMPHSPSSPASSPVMDTQPFVTSSPPFLALSHRLS